jgi:hypothetical protein
LDNIDAHHSSYDIIGLVETHLVESLPAPLNNYNIYHTYRKQNAKTKRNFHLPRIHDYNGFSLDNIDAHHSS